MEHNEPTIVAEALYKVPSDSRCYRNHHFTEYGVRLWSDGCIERTSTDRAGNIIWLEFQLDNHPMLEVASKFLLSLIPNVSTPNGIKSTSTE